MKITNLLIFIVLFGMFVTLFLAFIQIGTEKYEVGVNDELNGTLAELKAATQSEEINTITSSLDSDEMSVSSEGSGEILQYKKATSLVTTVKSIKPVTNTIGDSIMELHRDK